MLMKFHNKLFVYNFQIVKDELENEKEEKNKLQLLIDDLRNRPETAALVTAAVVTEEKSKASRIKGAVVHSPSLFAFSIEETKNFKYSIRS